MPLTSPPRIRLLRGAAAAVALLLAAVLLAACGTKGSSSSADVEHGPATVAPASAFAYGEVLVRPTGETGEGVSAALRKIVRVDDPGAELRRLLDEETGAGDRGLFSREIEPWLGDRVGAFAIDGGPGEEPDGAVVVSVKDRAAAEQALAQMRRDGDTRSGGSYEGVSYDVDLGDGTPIGLVGEFVVTGTLPGFRAAVTASRGRALAGESAFEEAAGRVPDDHLAWGYADGRRLARLIESQAQVDPELTRALDTADLSRLGTFVASLTARSDQVVLEVEGDGEQLPGDDEPGSVAIEDLPGDAWLALATPSLRSAIADALAGAGDSLDDVADLRQLRALTGLDVRRDLLSWIGGLGMFVRGTGPLDLGGGVVLGATDTRAAERFVARLQRLAGATGIPTAPTTGPGEGFQLQVPGLPQPIVVLAKGDRVAVSLGIASARDAVDPPEPFGDGEPGKSVIASLGEGYRPGFVLVVDPLVSLLTSMGAGSDPDFKQALPYLSAYRSLAIGTKEQDGRSAVKFVLALQEPDRDGG